jgi:predicted nucleic acid-binding protein
MIVVVADTSPINYLIQIGEINLLPKFFESVVIPETVRNELRNAKSPTVVRNWIDHPPKWIEFKTASTILYFELDLGEAEAISLAKELNAFAVIIDESEGRSVARGQGLRVTGTIGILERAAAENFLSFPECIAKLKRTTFHASEEILKAALARDLERREAGL